MDIQVIEKKEMKVVGISWNGTYSQTKEIPQVFHSMQTRMGEVSHKINEASIIAPFHSRETEFTYYVTTPVEKLENIPEGMVGFTIPNKNYVFATHQGSPAEVENTYRQMFLWMKEYGYEQDYHALGIEVHKQGESNQETLHFDIYLPVRTYEE